MSSMNPPPPPGSGPTQPPGPPAGFPTYPQVPEGRPVSFYVAIFVALLLFVSAGLNILLLLVTAFGSATGTLGGSSYSEDDGIPYETVTVGGDRNAEATVMRIPIDGAILETSSPLLGAAGGTVSEVRRALRAAKRQSIKGILLDINSPGGGVTDSDEIHRLLLKFKEQNPEVATVALFGDMAASGGYYVAAACDYIIARPTTITGSIGVIINSYNITEALGKIGVKDVTIVSEDTPYKDMLSATRPVDPEAERKILAIVQEMYELFVDVVDDGRPNLSRQEVKELATGEIYSAKHAERIGLVDDIGSIDDAMDKLAKEMEAESVRMVEHRRVPNVFDSLFGAQAASLDVNAALAQLLRSSTGPRFLYYWRGGR